MTGLCASTDAFLSHPITERRHSLLEHLKSVAERARQIHEQSNFNSGSLSYYAGLLHDIGKVNPIYQIAFKTGNGYECKEQFKILSEKYVRQHSIFSAWASRDLLGDIFDGNRNMINRVMVLVAGHHGSIRKNIWYTEDSRSKTTRQEIGRELHRFKQSLSEEHPLSDLDWNECLEGFDCPMKFNVDLSTIAKNEDTFRNYLEMSYAFSCLLQADRGSFATNSHTPHFDLKLDTDHLKNSKSSRDTDGPLDTFRSEFQKKVMNEFDSNRDISIINAPTGIGKTKVFLDIMNRFVSDPEIHRVFYFSPLLALTEDFEGKIDMVSNPQQREEILVYNHLHSESLAEKSDQREHDEGAVWHTSGPWNFDNESFNRKFTITTTMRLLMTIYSNKHSDKLKLASFRNALLIVDEVQTIPKDILSNLKDVFKCMSKYMKTKFILVSATIPHEIGDLERLGPTEDIKTAYLEKTKKKISVTDSLDPHTIPVEQTLVMSNTRKKAVKKYHEIKQAQGEDTNVLYVSSGIRKRDRTKIINELKVRSGYILVSTQVVEAGVDISFSHIFREWAPLDNILQVMGRLNREGDNADATLVIYSTDSKPEPYSPLEFKVTQEKMNGVKDSAEVYSILKEYYEEIYRRNSSSSGNTEKLNRDMARMDFEEVWKQVRSTVDSHGRDTVLIPDSDDWDAIKEDILGSDTTSNKMRKYGEISASLPSKVSDKENMFDSELMEKGILMPKKECLEDIYDATLGLDKHYLDNGV